MERVMVGVSAENGYVELSIIDESGEPVVIQIDGPTARALGDLLFKTGCDVPPVLQSEA